MYNYDIMNTTLTSGVMSLQERNITRREEMNVACPYRELNNPDSPKEGRKAIAR